MKIHSINKLPDSSESPRKAVHRSHWAALGAAVAVSIGAGGLMSASATIESGERSTYVPITPCRVLDTRAGSDNVGARATPVGQGETFSAQVRGANGNCTIPADAVGIVMNIAVVNPTAPSFLTVFPTDHPRPLAASINWVANQPPVSNSVTADIAADGRVSFFNATGTVDISADIVGYYADHNHDDRYAIKPTGVQFLHVDSSAFLPNQATAAYDISFGDLRSTGAPFQATAPVLLPQGATIVGIVASAYDTDVALNMAVELVRNATGPGALTQMALTGSVGTPGNVVPSTTSINNAVVDNVGFTYRLQTFSIGPNTRLYDVQVLYTLP